MRKTLSLMLLLLIGLFYSSAYAGQATTDLTLQVEGRAPVVKVVVALVPVMDDLLQAGVLQAQGEQEGVSVSLSLRGMKKYSDFARLKTFLQNLPKIVKSAYPCCLEWQRADFNLIIIGSVQSLVAELEKSGRYSLESLKKNKNVVEIHLQVKDEAQ